MVSVVNKTKKTYAKDGTKIKINETHKQQIKQASIIKAPTYWKTFGFKLQNNVFFFNLFSFIYVSLYAVYIEYFQPMFTSYSGEHNMPVKFKFVIGLPACGSMQTWPIYHYQGVSK